VRLLLAEEECQTATLCLRVGVVPCAAAHPVGGEAPLRRSAMLIAVESRRHPHSRRHPPALPGALHLYVLQRPHLALVSPAGLADIVGRRFGKGNPLPWNPEKSWAGSAAMFLGAHFFISSVRHAHALELLFACGRRRQAAALQACWAGSAAMFLGAHLSLLLTAYCMLACQQTLHDRIASQATLLAGMVLAASS